MGIQEIKRKFERAIADADETRALKRIAVLEKYKDADSFRKSLDLHFINRKDDQHFSGLYDFYSTFFCLPDETETLDGFEKVLDLNTDKNLLEKYGKFEEAWFYLRTKENNEMVAGVNFATYFANTDLRRKQDFCGTVHVTYIFVKNEYRNLGLANYLLELVYEYSRKFMGEAGSIVYFCEQNAPEMMSATEYFEDNLCALVDQCDRLIWWDKRGYKRLDFNYVQPPLNPGQNPFNNLTLNVKSPFRSEIIGAIVAFHLERFFAIAVLKGSDPINDATFVEQMKELEKLEFISLSGDQLYYQKLKEKIYLFPEIWEPLPKLF